MQHAVSRQEVTENTLRQEALGGALPPLLLREQLLYPIALNSKLALGPLPLLCFKLYLKAKPLGHLPSFWFCFEIDRITLDVVARQATIQPFVLVCCITKYLVLHGKRYHVATQEISCDAN